MSIVVVRPQVVSVLCDTVNRRAPSAWLELARSASDAAGLEAAVDEATRHVGRAPLILDAIERQQLCDVGVTWSLDAWCVDDAARAGLLVDAAGRLDADVVQAVIERRWGAGDGRQRCAVLRTLPLLPSAERFLGLALQARRGVVRRVFETLACDNPYPATYFHDVHFTDLVIAALEADLPLERIVGLPERVSADLTGRALRFAASRRASGRPVPADLWRVSGDRSAA
jgi:hypothetical protein